MEREPYRQEEHHGQANMRKITAQDIAIVYIAINQLQKYRYIMRIRHASWNKAVKLLAGLFGRDMIPSEGEIEGMRIAMGVRPE